MNTQKSSKHNDEEDVERTAEVAAVGRLFAARVGHRQQENGRVSVDRIGHVGCVTFKALIFLPKSRGSSFVLRRHLLSHIHAASTQNTSL